MPKSFFWFYIFLATNMTVSSLYDRAAVQTILFFSLGNMRQCKILLKNKYKKYKQPFFFVNRQFR